MSSSTSIHLNESFFVHLGTTAYKDLELKHLSDLGYKILILDNLGFRPKNPDCYHTYIFDTNTDIPHLAEVIEQFSSENQLLLGHVFTLAEGSVDILNLLCKKLNLPPIYHLPVESIRNKYEMRIRMRDSGHTIPTLHIATHEQEIPHLSEDLYPLIVKPVDSLDSRSVSKVNNHEELVTACKKVFYGETHLSADSGLVSVEKTYQMKPHAVIETYVEGYEYSTEVIVIHGQVRNRFITYKRNSGPPHFYEHGHTSGLEPFTQDVNTKLSKLILDLIKINRYQTTMLHIEFRVTPDQEVFLIECNSRLCGDQISDLIEKAYGIHVLDAFFKYISGEKRNLFPDKAIQIASRFYLTSENEGFVKLKKTHIAGFKIQWWKNDGEAIHHLATVGITRVGSVDVLSKDANELEFAEKSFLENRFKSFEVLESQPISIADHLSQKIGKLYFWVLSLLSVFLIISTAMIQAQEYKRTLITIGKNVSNAILPDVIDGEIFPIAQKLRALGFLEVADNVNVTDRDLLSYYSSDQNGLPNTKIYSPINGLQYEFKLPIESDGILQGYLFFNRNRLRFWGPISLLAFAILLTLTLMYFLITKKIVPSAIKTSAEGIQKISDLVISLGKDLSQITQPNLKNEFILLEKAQKELSSMAITFSEVRALRESTSEILTVLRKVSREIEEKARLSTRYELLHQNMALQNERQKVTEEISRQVAHDIRSPLAALKVATKDLMALPEDYRLLIQSATARINDIANDLLQRQKKSSLHLTQDEKAPVLMLCILESILSEKRIQYSNRNDLKIEIRSESRSFDFALAHSSELKRTLSNLINNAIEATEDNGTHGMVTISICGNPSDIQVLISDNGRGIAPEKLVQLGAAGYSFGKKSGTGLGIYHAKSYLQSIGGRFSIQSEWGVGSTIALSIPKAETPSWFASELRLKPSSTVVILDDDPSVHEVWNLRLSEAEKKMDIRLMHFSQAEEALEWSKNNPNSQNILYLIDYELRSQDWTGVDVIKNLNIADQSLLVTSRYEDLKLHTESQSMGLRILPKFLASEIPIHLASP